MIGHIFIKNYKAFKRESIVLGDHTLFIGTNNSGKTTVLDALDVFFNHRLERAYVRNKKHPVIIECLIDDKRYRKVFSPPNHRIDTKASIGDFSEISHLRYLYFQQHPNPLDVVLNDCIQPFTKPGSFFVDDFIKKTSYVDPSPQLYYQKNTMIYDFSLPLNVSKKDQRLIQKDLLNSLDLSFVILGIDRIEKTIPSTASLSTISQAYQSIITTKQKQIVDNYPHHIQPLYKTSITREIETITKTVSKNYKMVFLLVEGKYDVPWFEKALRLLNKHQTYRVIPCGGAGNMRFVQKQLKKAGYKTVVITDGDVQTGGYQLKRDIIELYADVKTINSAFKTSFDAPPKTKALLFDAIKKNDDVVKQVLASWALHHLTESHKLTQEIKTILENFESSK